MGCYYQEYIGKDFGGGHCFEYSVVKMIGAHHQSEKTSVGEMNVYMKVGVPYIESPEPHALF